MKKVRVRSHMRRTKRGKRVKVRSHTRTLSRETKGLIITGGKTLNELYRTEEGLYTIGSVLDYVEEIANEYKEITGKELSERKKWQIAKLILGIMKRYGEFDERYHKYLLGELLR